MNEQIEDYRLKIDESKERKAKKPRTQGTFKAKLIKSGSLITVEELEQTQA